VHLDRPLDDVAATRRTTIWPGRVARYAVSSSADAIVPGRSTRGANQIGPLWRDHPAHGAEAEAGALPRWNGAAGPPSVARGSDGMPRAVSETSTADLGGAGRLDADLRRDRSGAQRVVVRRRVHPTVAPPSHAF
jgi:hypothetical protein